MDFAEQVRDFVGPALALDGFAHQRGRGDGDRAALAFESHVLHDAVLANAQGNVQPIAAQRIVPSADESRRLERAEMPRALVVVEDDLAIQSLRSISRYTSRALASAATSASMSDSRE